MKNKVLKALIVELLIITLVMADFILLGMNLITYALETVNNTTNNENVKFAAYFITEEGETSHAEYEINSEEMMLYLKVEVKNDGYFDGVITLEDCNFILNQDELPEGVKKIEGNTITLNTVRADEPSQEIAIKIKSKIEENYDYNMLEKSNVINLSGSYYNSTEEIIKIDTDKEVKLNLLAPSDIETTLSGKVITNTTQYQIDGSSKRIVQLQLNSRVIKNVYPIKATSLEMQLPDGIEVLNVISKGTYVTNGKSDRKLEENIDYNWEKENKLLQITINNEPKDEKISWEKGTEDNLIVTLILPIDTQIAENEYKVKSKIEFYGIENKIIEKEIIYNLIEEADGIIGATIINNEEIYKGKIYSKEERVYNSTTNIEINYANLLEGNTLEETTVYKTENEIKSANIQYKTTSIKKSEIEKILGTEGKLTIKNELDEVIAEITSNTISNEEGNIVITYQEGTKSLKIELTKAIETGIIRLNHTKVIKAEGYEKEEITSLKYLVENAKIKYANVESEINLETELKETRTLTELTVVPQTLSTATKNEEVKIALTLRTDSERFDLYKNPEITIKLPDYVKNFEPLSATPFYMDEFKIENFTYVYGTKEIKLKMTGEQTSYSGINNNPYIEIIANIELEEQIASRQDQITLTYSNEKAVVYENNLENGMAIVPINIVGHNGLVAFNSITNYNVTTNSAISNTENIANLKMYQSATEANSQMVLLNNTGEDLTNVTVVGNLPVDGNIQLRDYNFENTVGATLKTGLNISSGSGSIYYTSNPNATEILTNEENGWNSNLAEVSNPVLYMIVIPNMQKGTNFVANYTMNIPANLGYSQDMRTAYVASYEAGNATGIVSAEPVGLETGSVVTSLEAYVSGEKIDDGSTVKSGEVIRYKITVENTGSSDATNVQVTGLVPEGTVYVEPFEDFIYSVPEYTYYLENANKENVTFTITNLKGGEITTLEYEVRVNSDITQETAKNQITTVYNSDIEIKSNEVINNLEAGNIRVTIKRRTDLSIILKEGKSAEYYVTVENLTEENQSNVEVVINMPSIFTSMSVRANSSENVNYETTENGVIIDELEANETQVYLVRSTVADTIESTIIKEAITATAKYNNANYRSNAYYETIYGIDVNMTMTVTNEEEYLKTDDTIDYEISIVNNSQIYEGEHDVEISIPSELTVQRIQINGVEQEVTNENYFIKRLGLDANSTTRIKITAVVDYDPTRDETKTITTFARLLYSGIEVQKTEEFMHYIEAAVEKQPDEIIVPENPETPEEPNEPEVPVNPGDTENPDNSLDETPDIPEGPADPVDPSDPENPIEPEEPTNPDNPENPTEPEKPEIPNEPEETTKKYSISGKAWLDQDKDGAKGKDDKTLLGIKVRLLNIETNQFVRNEDKNKDLIIETDEEGYYIFENIEEGKYLVVFEYDTEWYKTTTYEKEGVVESKNSNVISKKLTINGQEKEYATTNELELNKNLQNIDMGLVFAKRFDLTLEKYITKTIVQTSKETKTYDYENEDFAKVEINAKRMIGANVLVQYTLKLTNTGDVEAYVNSIVDYMPAGFKFNSELNKDWYEVGGNLCTNVLEGIAIAPGETKEINLILTKTKTDGNAELINNMAEINEAYNIYGIADTNSKEGNKNKDENDLGSADFMISIQTGNVISYLAIVIAMIIPIGIAVYIMSKKILLKEEF